MANFTYKVKPGDTLVVGDSSNAVNIPSTLAVTSNATVGGTLAVTGATSLTKQVHTYEEVTTTGTSDVVDPAKEFSLITSGGAHTVTLADGTYDGQVKTITITDVTAGTITITPANFADGTSITMAEIFDSVTLIFDGTDWNVASASGIAIV